MFSDEKTLKIRQDKPSQHVMIDELVKISRRHGSDLIVVEMAETLNTRQDKHSQRYLILETVKQSSRNGRKLMVAEIAETLLDIKTNTHSDTRFVRLSNTLGEVKES